MARLYFIVDIIVFVTVEINLLINFDLKWEKALSKSSDEKSRLEALVYCLNDPHLANIRLVYGVLEKKVADCEVLHKI